MEIKVRGLSRSVVNIIDEQAKKLGYKSRNEFLNEHLETYFLYQNKLKEQENKYDVLLKKVLKVLEYNTEVLKVFNEENFIDLEKNIKEKKQEE